MIGALGIFESALSMVQLFGFTVKSHTAMAIITNSTGLGQFLLGIFAGGDGGSGTAAILAGQERLERDIQELGNRIAQDMKTSTIGLKMAAVSAEQDWLQKKFADFDPQLGPFASTLTLHDYNALFLPQLNQVFGPQSKLMDAWTWAIQNEDVKYSTLSLYLSAVSLYLNYAQFLASLEWWFRCNEYLNLPDRTGVPLPVFNESLKHTEILTSLGPTLDNAVAYLSLHINALQAGILARSKAVASAPRLQAQGNVSHDPLMTGVIDVRFGDTERAGLYTTLQNSVFRWNAHRSETEKHHLENITPADAAVLDESLRTLIEAQQTFHRLHGTKCPPITYLPPHGYFVQEGDTLASILKKLGLAEDLVSYVSGFNHLANPDVIVPGQYLAIPSQAQISEDKAKVEADRAGQRFKHQMELNREWSRKHHGAVPFFDVNGNGHGNPKRRR